MDIMAAIGAMHTDLTEKIGAVNTAVAEKIGEIKTLAAGQHANLETRVAAVENDMKSAKTWGRVNTALIPVYAFAHGIAAHLGIRI
jgi:hypothetical protein